MGMFEWYEFNNRASNGWDIVLTGHKQAFKPAELWRTNDFDAAIAKASELQILLGLSNDEVASVIMIPFVSEATFGLAISQPDRGGSNA